MLAAQNATPPATTPAEPAAKSQDPDRPSKTPAELLQELTRERDRLQTEIRYVEGRAKTAIDLLRAKFSRRGFAPKAIDAGQSAAVAAAAAMPIAPMTPLRARLFTDVESKALKDDVIMTVDGSMVAKAEVDQLLAYLDSAPSSGEQAQKNERAMMDLVRVHTLLAGFPDTSTEAKANILSAREELQQGGDFTEVMNRYGRGPNQANEGRVQVTRSCPWGLAVEAAAFQTKDGELAPVVAGLTGYVLLKVEAHKKGDQPLADAVDVRMILVPFNEDQPSVDKHRARAAMGQIEVACRGAEVMAMLPAILRPPVKEEMEEPIKTPVKDGATDGK